MISFKTELNWLGNIYRHRFSGGVLYKETPRQIHYTGPLVPESLFSRNSFLSTLPLSPLDNLTLVLALVSEIAPGFLKNIMDQAPNGISISHAGYARGHNGFIPTGETVMFLMGNSEPATVSMVKNLFSSEHVLIRENLLHTEVKDSGCIWLLPGKTLLECTKKPLNHSDIQVTGELITFGNHDEIPVTNRYVLHQLVKTIEILKNKRPGVSMRILFHGPGNGKKNAAIFLGKNARIDLFSIDLHHTLSKYIGETEKNLSTVFEHAQKRNWILFFDEADALFGKRTSIRIAGDDDAVISTLIRNIDNYPGLVILTTNTTADEELLNKFHRAIVFMD